MNTLEVSVNRKTYPNGTCAIEGLNVSANQGEFVAIVGPSGSGKTTLLNIIAGIDQEYEGNIQLNDNSSSIGDIHQPDIGFMFQESRLMPWLTLRENIQMVVNTPSQNGKLTEDQNRYLMTLLEKVGLSEFADNFPNQLSGGMKRRASLVRAFINHPPLLLMDEPFQSLDAPTANALRKILMDLWMDTKPIVLFVTHTLREALALADRVIFLSGRPSSVILEHQVSIPRPRKLEDDTVNNLHAQLLTQHPQLLSGTSSSDN